MMVAKWPIRRSTGRPARDILTPSSDVLTRLALDGGTGRAVDHRALGVGDLGHRVRDQWSAGGAGGQSVAAHSVPAVLLARWSTGC